MVDLIDRQKVLSLPRLTHKTLSGEIVAEYISVADIEALPEEPSAQPEIIRCKDCKHYQFANNRAFGTPVKMCKWLGFEDFDDDDFCSQAERRTDD